MLTVEQALAMRTALLELHKRDYVGIFFDQSGVKALTAGHIREGLEIDRDLIASAPSDACIICIWRALCLKLGSATKRRRRRSGRPNSTQPCPCFATYGWTLEHSALGERFGKGFDLPGAIAAYKKALALDSEGNDPRFDSRFSTSSTPRESGMRPIQTWKRPFRATKT